MTQENLEWEEALAAAEEAERQRLGWPAGSNAPVQVAKGLSFISSQPQPEHQINSKPDATLPQSEHQINSKPDATLPTQPDPFPESVLDSDMGWDNVEQEDDEWEMPESNTVEASIPPVLGTVNSALDVGRQIAGQNQYRVYTLKQVLTDLI